MIVLCDGMPRSASTWSFNVCARLISAAFPGDAVHSGYDESFTRVVQSIEAGCKHLVLKSHTLDGFAMNIAGLGGAKVVYTHRDPIDAVASQMKMFGAPFEDALEAIRKSWQLFCACQRSSNVCAVPYEIVVRQPLAAVDRISAYLGITLAPAIIQEISSDSDFERMKQRVERISSYPASALVDLGSTAYDKATLLHRNHIRNGGFGYGKTALTPEQQRVVAETMINYPVPADGGSGGDAGARQT